MELSEEIRKHNGIFFEEAKSGDPTHKIPGCENLVENLIATMEIINNTQFNEKLKKCKWWARRAHYDYYENRDVRKAMEWCNAIMQELTPICYNKTYVTPSAKSFVGNIEVKK